MHNLNLFSAFLTARAVLPGMLERGSGKLVFISSKAGSQPAPNTAAYSVSKGGLELLVRDLAEEVRQRGVNVNAVAASVLDTPANRKANPDADWSAWVQPESIAGVIHFLASDAARDVHGTIVPVFGRS
jgi:NAD(P)-dependent dehydrogenase (short-subunit alcohol dehydrogenase family)